MYKNDIITVKDSEGKCQLVIVCEHGLVTVRQVEAWAMCIKKLDGFTVEFETVEVEEVQGIPLTDGVVDGIEDLVQDLDD